MDRSVAIARPVLYELCMSTVEEIVDAIKTLPAAERGRLADALPALVPELDGDARWEAIIRDPTPRPKLTAYLDEVDARFRENPEQFRELTDDELDKHE